MGGMIAQLILIEHRQRVSSLTVVNTCIGPGAGPYKASLCSLYQLGALDKPEGAPDYDTEAAVEDIIRAKGDYYKALSGEYWDSKWNRVNTTNRVRRMTQGYPEYNRGCTRSVCAVIVAPDRCHNLVAIQQNVITRVPILVFHGKLDPVLPYQNALEFHKVPHAVVVLDPKGGHVVGPAMCRTLLKEMERVLPKVSTKHAPEVVGSDAHSTESQMSE